MSIYIDEIFDSMNCGRFGAKMKGVPTLTPTVQGRDAATLRNSTVRIKYRRHINLYLFQNELGEGLLLLALAHHEQRRWNSD